MTSYRELYDNMQNPLDNQETILKLLNAYSIRSQGLGGLYGSLIRTVDKEKNLGPTYNIDKDHFFSVLFNKWKNSIVNMDVDRFIELRNKGEYGNDLKRLRDYLKTVPDITTKKEADSIFAKQYDDKDLNNAMNKYRWNAFGEETGWIHVCSRYLTAKQDKINTTLHRLYLNPELGDMYPIMTEFMKKCEERKLPYYFKFDESADRDDTVVIYSNSKNLMSYIEILREMQQENSERISRIKEPPLLTGKIDGWIGYGSEPEEDEKGNKQSFNDVRCKFIEPIMERKTKQWVMHNRNKKIKYHGSIITIEDYIARKATEVELNKLYFPFKYKSKNETNETVAKRKGYDLAELHSKEFRKKIYDEIRNNISSSIPILCKGKPSDVESIVLNVKNGKLIIISGYVIDAAIEQIATNIAEHDKNFLHDVKEEIEKKAKEYGIDINKFCFDIKRRDELFKIDQLTNQQDNDNSKATNEQNEQTQSQIRSIKIVDYLNSTLMKKKMKLPNGAEISAIQYIQEIVAPYIPETGKFILKNGQEISAKQYIEEIVMFEGQEKFNGNILSLLHDTVKANNGTINKSSFAIEKDSNQDEESEQNILNEGQGKIKMKSIKEGLSVSEITIGEVERTQYEVPGKNELNINGKYSERT